MIFLFCRFLIVSITFSREISIFCAGIFVLFLEAINDPIAIGSLVIVTFK